MTRDQFTNQRFQGLFKNYFELTNYAIRLGRYRIKSGHELSLDSLLDEIEKHPNPNYLNDLEAADSAEEQEENE